MADRLFTLYAEEAGRNSSTSSSRDRPSRDTARSVRPSARRETAQAPAARRETALAPLARRETAQAPSARRETALAPLARRETALAPSARRETAQAPSARRETALASLARRETTLAPSARRETAQAPSARRETAQVPSARRDTALVPSTHSTRRGEDDGLMGLVNREMARHVTRPSETEHGRRPELVHARVSVVEAEYESNEDGERLRIRKLTRQVRRVALDDNNPPTQHSSASSRHQPQEGSCRVTDQPRTNWVRE